MSTGPVGPPPRDQRRLRRTVPLSPLPAERALQWWIIVLATWFVLVGIAVTIVRDTESAGFDEHWPARVAAGVVAVAIAGWVHVLISRHRGAIATVQGLQGQYRQIGVAGVVLGTVGLVPWWWAGPVVALVSLAGWARVRRIPTVPVAEMTERIDYDSPEHWAPRGRFADRPRLYIANRLVGALLAGLVLAAVIVGVLLLGDRLS